MLMGTLIRKIHDQPKLSVIQPPSIGPMTGARMVVEDHIDRAMLRRSGGLCPSISACDSGTMKPPAAPCMMRNATRLVRLQAKPLNSDMSANISVANTIMRTWPKRPATHPVSGTVIACATE